ncbi:YihY/virulence factor BrkB family protein [Terrisporobacter vanillatitrophus]|uniref:YihY/virulence factor BrkB family protein n=1 Tax=Terrisporobacter vanillatitrophus TaxID=3058402 RepID=UPI003368F171
MKNRLNSKFQTYSKKMKFLMEYSNYREINSKAAEMSFYLLLSFFPFLIFTISLVVYTPIIKISKYIFLLKKILPLSAFNIVSSLMQSAIENRSFSFLILSFMLAMYTMSRAVLSLIRGMNRSYNIRETRPYFEVLFISLVFVIMLVVLIFTSMIFLVFGEKLGSFLFNLIGLDQYFMYIWNLCRYVVGIITVIIILMNLYRFTPNKKLSFKDVLPGAIVSTLCWLVASFCYSFYSNNFARYDIIYGSLGGIIVLMTWVYLSSWTILIGCEINARLYKRKIR